MTRREETTWNRTRLEEALIRLNHNVKNSDLALVYLSSPE